MSNTLKNAFDQIHADEELKDRTKEYLFRKTNGYMKVKKIRVPLLDSGGRVFRIPDTGRSLAVFHPCSGNQHRYQSISGIGYQPV